MGEYAVDHIVGHKTVRGQLRYKIRWVGYSAKEDTWQRPDDLKCDKLLEAYWKQHGAKPLPVRPIKSAMPLARSCASRKPESDIPLPMVSFRKPKRPRPPLAEREVPVHDEAEPRSPSPRAESPLRSPSPLPESPLRSPSPRRESPLHSPSPRPESPLHSPSPRPKSPLRSPSPHAKSPLLSRSPRPESPLRSPPPQEWPEGDDAENANDAVQLIKDEGPQQVFSVCRHEDELWYRVLFDGGQSRWIRSELLMLAAATLIIDFLHTRFEDHYMGDA